MRFILAILATAALTACATSETATSKSNMDQVASAGLPAACAGWAGSRAGRPCPYDHP